MAVEWNDIETAASKIFKVWNSGGDLAFAKEAWAHLGAAGLTGDDNIMYLTETYLRLLTIRRICGGYFEAEWDEKTYSQDIYFAADELDINRLAVGLLAGPIMGRDTYQYDQESDLLEAALMAKTDALRAEVFGCLQHAYGGASGLYERLSRAASDNEDEDSDEIELDGDLDAFNFLGQEGRPRTSDAEARGNVPEQLDSRGQRPLEEAQSAWDESRSPVDKLYAPPAGPANPDFGANNKLFTRERHEALRERLRQKLDPKF